MLGPAYTIAEASANQHELNPSSIIMMTHLKLFILLSMLMTGSISQIRYNDNLKYEKSCLVLLLESLPWMIHTFPLSTHFQTMSTCTHMVNGSSSTSDVEIHDGWKAHHDRMTGDPNLGKWAPAWHLHDCQLCAQFANQPFLVDLDSITYLQQFERAHVDFLAEEPVCSNCQLKGEGPSSRLLTGHNHTLPHYLPYDQSNKGPLSSDSFCSPCSPHNPQATLCVRCRHYGHRAASCQSDLNHKDQLIIVTWKNDRLVLKVNKPICLIYNACRSCHDHSMGHANHSCSLCADPHHGAAQCTQN